MTAQPRPLAAGEVLDGKYKIVREIGRGAMGVVYEALHVALGRRVAVKTLLAEMGHDPHLGARFEREARAASAIGHPHIVDVFDLGRTPQGLLFMVMELLDGESLAATLRRVPKLPIPLATNLIAQVLGGLSAAHKHGIVHRDLKPDNIFILTSDDRPNFVKIVDFGISKVLDQHGPVATTKGHGTMVGSILGTPLYMSPEQAVGQVPVIDHRTDIYSAGVVLYEMVCGRTPFVGEAYPQILAALLDGGYPAPRSLRPDLPSALEKAIVRALDRDMQKRFESAAEMREVILGTSSEETPGPIVLSPAIGEPLAAPAQGPPGPGPGSNAGGVSSIALLEAPPPPAKGADKRRGPRGADPFAPPPEAEMSPLLADDLDRPLALRAPRIEEAPPPREIPVRENAATPPRAVKPGTLAPGRVISSKTRSRVSLALGVLALAVLVRVGYSYFRTDGSGAISRRGDPSKVLLTVVPSHATVQIDHVPTSQRELALVPDTEHVVNAAAGGRVTRRFGFKAAPGLELTVHLGRSIPLVSAGDPAPLASELAADYPDEPKPLQDIEAAFVKLDRYADCLALAGDTSADNKRGRGRLRAEELDLCQRLLREASAMAPPMPELQGAGQGYVRAVEAGQRTDALAKLAATFRAEYLAARAAWQMDELARIGKDQGQAAAWHMRRVALAAQTWARAARSGQGPMAESKRKLDEAYDALIAFAESEGPGRQAGLRIGGSAELVQAARELMALARGPGKPGDFAILDGSRRVISAFNALILD